EIVFHRLKSMLETKGTRKRRKRREPNESGDDGASISSAEQPTSNCTSGSVGHLSEDDQIAREERMLEEEKTAILADCNLLAEVNYLINFRENFLDEKRKKEIFCFF